MTNSLDEEWIAIITEVFKSGIDPNEIRSFLNSYVEKEETTS